MYVPVFTVYKYVSLYALYWQSKKKYDMLIAIAIFPTKHLGCWEEYVSLIDVLYKHKCVFKDSN